MSIGALVFSFVHQVDVKTSWENLTDVATIQLPQNLKLDSQKLRTVIKPGDAVEIRCGYDGDLKKIYSGYIVGISPKVPVEILCEDESWQLKQNTITDSLQNSDIESLFKKHFNEYKFRVLNTHIGNYQIDKASRAKILLAIKQQFGLYSFFRNGVLTCGFVYDLETANRVTLDLQKNNTEKTHSLTYMRKEDVRLQVVAISNNSDGSKLEIRIGDEEGEQRSLNFFNLGEKELREAANREMERLKYDGYRGTFKTFGAPLVRHGDIVTLTNPEESDKTGSFWVDAVDYEFGVSGFRQTIKLGPKA